MAHTTGVLLDRNQIRGLRQSLRLLRMQKFSLADLESEDLLLILVLYLMYRESGDKELLFILGGMLFL